MIMIDNLREVLVEKHDVKVGVVDSLVRQIGEFSPMMTEVFEKWLETGEIGDTEVEGYTVKSIIEKHPMTVVSAFATLSWLEKDPNEAKKALNKGRILNSAAERKS
jgi:ATP-dependent DNA ligase